MEQHNGWTDSDRTGCERVHVDWTGGKHWEIAAPLVQSSQCLEEAIARPLTKIGLSNDRTAPRCQCVGTGCYAGSAGLLDVLFCQRKIDDMLATYSRRISRAIRGFCLFMQRGYGRSGRWHSPSAVSASRVRKN